MKYLLVIGPRLVIPELNNTPMVLQNRMALDGLEREQWSCWEQP